MLLETAITVISLGVQIPNNEYYQATRDIYKMVVATTMPSKNEPIEKSFIGNFATSTAFFGNAIPTITTWNMTLQALVPPVNSIHVAFDKVGINRAEGDQLLILAKGILAEMKYAETKVTSSIVNDPEENVSYLTLRLHLDADFETTLKLDSILTRELVSRTESLPEKLSFAVYELE